MRKFFAITGRGLSAASGIPDIERKKEMRKRITLDNKTANYKDYCKALDEIRNSFNGKEPNDAHYALKDFGIPVITVNTDMLHQKAGSGFVAELRGNVYNPKDYVSFNEKVRSWDKAADLVNSGQSRDVLLLIGISMKAPIVRDFVTSAISKNMKVVEINKNIATETRKTIEREMEDGRS